MISKIKTQSGISMMEMMIVCVIIGLLAAIAVPNFGGAIKKMKFDNAGREILSKMRHARAAAVSTQKPTGVAFDNVGKSLITFIDTVSPELGQYEVGDSILQRDTLAVNLTVMYSTFTGNAVVFNPDGTASQSGDVMCAGYVGGETKSFSVSLVAGSGRARLESYN